MAKRRVDMIENGNLLAKVFYDPDYSEYQVRLYERGILNPDSDYFTGDLSDANGTALMMVGANPNPDPEPASVDKWWNDPEPMTRAEYIGHLRALYFAANDSDNENRAPWMKGDECATHCQQFDKIARDMNLSDNWLEESDYDYAERSSAWDNYDDNNG